MKLVRATVNSGAVYPGNETGITPASITIPALTGSQIAVIYLQASPQINVGEVKYELAASGTGVDLALLALGISPVSGTAFTNSLATSATFGTTTTGSQTINFSVSILGYSGGYQYTMNQAAVFIYTPPF
jgi:hypothetical protein